MSRTAARTTDAWRSHAARAAAGLLAAALALAIGGANVTAAPEPGQSKMFETWTGYESGRFLEAVVAADLNGDGKPDAAWARNDFFNNQMIVQLNLGDGTLSSSVGYPARSQSNDVEGGDLDGDGDVDLVVVSQGDDFRNSIVDVYLNNGAGAFTRRTVTGGSGPKRAAMADLDRDGDRDLALTNYWSTSQDVSVLLNNGDATFAPERRYVVGPAPHGVTAGDLDGDVDLDLAVAGHNSDTGATYVALLRNNGAGVFSLAKTITLAGDRMGDPSIVDASFDADGDVDLAVAGIGTNQVTILTNTGNLEFGQNVEVSQFSAFDLLARDLDVDGDVDLAHSSYESDSGELAYLRNSGNGTFAAPIRIASGRNPHGLDAADFDANTLPDLAVANRLTDTGAIHPQRQDGSFAAPPIYETNADLPLSVATADFDGDADVDVALGSADRVQITLNAGDGSLSLAGFVPACSICREGVTPYVRDLWAAELNGDGAPDLVWAPDAPPYPYVYALNNGNGTFGPIRETPIDTCGTGAATTADVDNDGDQDIMVANNRSGPSAFCEAVDDMVRVALNNGNGTFADDYGVTVHPLPQKAVGADLNRDGRTDIVAASIFVSVARGTGGGSFAPPVLYDARGNDLMATDLDGDGDLDVATTDRSMWNAWVLLNDGSGNLSQMTSYPGEEISGYANNFALDIADLDADGLLDLVIANPSGNNVAVHFGVAPGRFETEQLRYGAHTCFLDVEAREMNGDARLDLVGPGCSTFGAPAGAGVTVLLNSGGAGGVDRGEIAGRVRKKGSRKGIPGALVDCPDAGSDTTNSRGRYRIPDVPPGTYTCTASANGYQSLSKSVTVQSGQTATLNFALRPA